MHLFWKMHLWISIRTLRIIPYPTRARKILRALVFLFPSIYSADTFIDFFVGVSFDSYAVIFVNRALRLRYSTSILDTWSNSFLSLDVITLHCLLTVDHDQMTSRWIYFTCAKSGWRRHACGRRKFINVCCINAAIISSAEPSFVFRYTQERYCTIVANLTCFFYLSSIYSFYRNINHHNC